MVEWDDLHEEMTQDPVHIINSLGLAMFQIISESDVADDTVDLPEPDFKDTIYCRIANFTPMTLLRDVRVSYFGRTFCHDLAYM